MSKAGEFDKDIALFVQQTKKWREKQREDCEHSDLEDAICLDCGKDLTEKLMCDAYDRAKDRWKE
jgi:hypothetical protein